MSVRVGGREVTLPVHVREATMTGASFLGSARAARRELVDTPYEPVVVLGHCIVTLAVVRYLDGDLDAYDEVGLLVAVTDPLGTRGVWTAELPVTQPFTMEAGRRIWGLPKWRAEIRVEHHRRRTDVVLHDDDEFVLAGRLRHGVPVPARTIELATVTTFAGDGAVHPGTAPGEMTLEGLRIRPGGAQVVLGDHRMGRRAAALGVDGRAITTMHARRMTLSLGEVRPTSAR